MDNPVNWALFLVVNGLALYSAYCFSGYFLKRSLSPDMPALSLGIAATGILYFAHITLIVLFLGVVLKYLNLHSVIIASVALSMMLVYRFRGDSQPFAQPLKQALGRIAGSRDVFLYLVVLIFIIQVFILIAKVVILPPHIWDVFAYHLTPAVEWFQQGMIPPVLDTPVKRINAQPLGMTILGYWYFIFFRDDFLVELPQLLWALLLVPVSYAVMRVSDVSENWSRKFSVLIFFIPIVLMQAVTAKDHLGLNVGFFSALLFIFLFLRNRDHRLLLLAASAFGLSLGYKLSSPPYLIITMAYTFIFILLGHKQLLTDSNERAALIKTFFLSGLIMVLIGGYWYIRNLVVYDSLMGALSVKGEPTAITAAIEKQARFYDWISFDTLIKNINDAIPRIFDYQAFYGADLPLSSGFGPQFSAFGIFAIIAAIVSLFIKRYRSHPSNFIAWTAVTLIVAYFVFYYSNNNYRLFSFLPMIMIAYAAIVLNWLGVFRSRLSVSVINVVIVVSIGWNLFHILPPSYTNVLALKEFVSLDAGHRTSANYTRWFNIRPSMYKLIGDFPASEPIAYISKFGKNFSWEVPEDTWSYLYFDRNWERRIKYLNQDKNIVCNENLICRSTDEMRATLIENKISLVSTCKVNMCLKLMDPEFVELVPGLYYFKGR